jgi:hypothetical protein
MNAGYRADHVVKLPHGIGGQKYFRSIKQDRRSKWPGLGPAAQ